MNIKHTGPGLTLKCRVQFDREERGRLKLRPAKAAQEPTAVGRVPRIARLMALAIRCDDLLRRGEVKDLAELARVGHVTRARMTQIMNLLMLAPDIQEQILFLPLITAGREPLKEWQIRPVAAQIAWAKQRRMWKTLAGEIAAAALVISVVGGSFARSARFKG